MGAEAMASYNHQPSLVAVVQPLVSQRQHPCPEEVPQVLVIRHHHLCQLLVLADE